jgi:hypothetical protein
MSSNDLLFAISEGIDKKRPLLRRRDFLALSSLVAASQLVPGFVSEAFARPLEPVVRPMSLAYIAGSDQIRNLKRLPRQIRRPLAVPAEADAGPTFFAVPSSEVPLGNPDLVGRPLRLRVHGLYPPAALDRSRVSGLPLAADLEVLYPFHDPALGPVLAPFLAWSLRRQGTVLSSSPPVRFTFPLDWQVMPELALTVYPGQTGVQPLRLVTRFTLDDEQGLPRLQRGVYLLGFEEGIWDRTEVSLVELAKRAPARAFSILFSMESAEEA